jgi:hypothetical protein
MQTFLPVADFADSARLLDSPRLGKQRVETLADPAGDRTPRLRLGQPPRRPDVARPHAGARRLRLAMARIWRERGFGDTTETQIGEFAPQVVGVPQAELADAGLLPSWLGDEALHRSHRSNLIAKDPDFYRPRFAELFGPEPDDPALRLAAGGRGRAGAGAAGRPRVGGAAAGARRARRLPGRGRRRPGVQSGSTWTPPACRPPSSGRCRRS